MRIAWVARWVALIVFAVLVAYYAVHRDDPPEPAAHPQTGPAETRFVLAPEVDAQPDPDAPAAQQPGFIGLTAADSDSSLYDGASGTWRAAVEVRAAHAVYDKCRNASPFWEQGPLLVGKVVFDAHGKAGHKWFVNVSASGADKSLADGNELWYMTSLDEHGASVAIRPLKRASADLCAIDEGEDAFLPAPPTGDGWWCSRDSGLCTRNKTQCEIVGGSALDDYTICRKRSSAFIADGQAQNNDLGMVDRSTCTRLYMKAGGIKVSCTETK